MKKGVNCHLFSLVWKPPALPVELTSVKSFSFKHRAERATCKQVKS